MAFSTIREAISSIRSPQRDVPEADGWTAHAGIERLAGVGLAAEAGLELQVLPHRVDRGPEGRGRQFDDRVPDRPFDLPVLDKVRLAARVLRIVPLVIDVPLHEGFHVHAELDVLN